MSIGSGFIRKNSGFLNGGQQSAITRVSFGDWFLERDESAETVSRDGRLSDRDRKEHSQMAMLFPVS